MTMDLMYGCGSEYDPSLEDLLEVDLKAEMDRIIAASANGHPFEFMAEFEFSSSHFRLPYDDDRFDDLMMEKYDPLSWPLNNNSPIKKEPPELSSAVPTKIATNHQIQQKNQPQRVPSPQVKTIGKIVNGVNGKKVVITNGVVKTGPNGKSQLVTKNGANGINKNGIKNGYKNYNNTSKVNGSFNNNNNVTVNAKILAGKTNGKSVNRAVVASVGSLSMSGFATNEDSLGKWVDPSTILPASVSSTSSISESESDVPTEFPTDDESESEAGQQTNTIWIVPRKRLLTSGGNNSPNDLHEYELDEPEFIITDGALEEAQQPKKKKQKHEPLPHTDGKIYPKPGFSYSCLIAMSLKNSKTGSLPVSEIYKFMCDHFPYFKSAPSGWKNSVRHNLSLNKCFEKIEKPGNNGARKGCLWALNPAKIHKMDEEVQKWTKKDPMSIKKAMSDPENLELLERGELKRDYSGTGSDDDEDEEEGSGHSSGNSRPRGSSTDTLGAETIMSTTTPTTKISQVHSVSMSRPTEQKIHVKSEPRDSIDLSTIANVQGNLICQPGTGPGTYTLSFSTMNNTSTTPIIIRRTTVK